MSLSTRKNAKAKMKKRTLLAIGLTMIAASWTFGLYIAVTTYGQTRFEQGVRSAFLYMDHTCKKSELPSLQTQQLGATWETEESL